MTNLELELIAWHERHYGPAVDIPATYRKLLEEVGELGEALMRGDQAAVREEAGDVAIVLFHVLRGAVSGASLMMAMDAALNKCETAQWRAKHEKKQKARQ